MGAVLGWTFRESGRVAAPPAPEPARHEWVQTGPLPDAGAGRPDPGGERRDRGGGRRDRGGERLGWGSARLTVSDAASLVRVETAALPGLLYRVSSAPDAGVAPVVVRRGERVAVRLRATGSDGLDEVRIVLNRDVRWDIRLPAGAGEQRLNLRGGRVSRVVLGASGLAEMWLPDPAGTVPVTFAGGVGTVVVTAGTPAPFRIVLDGGAGEVDTPWITTNGTPGGAILQEAGWRRTADRYAVRAADGLGSVILRRHLPVRHRRG
ncbi:hypothetical protein GCM10010168_53640 [Actinoplanes ianthinogenes]|uniref:Uncharacterized protein n=1 Tax=Actinoplanes ianthinogenes TaxID=122358 RepID=A0ABN6C9E4_9ACTN|nr:hypothetical protein [Actinoplanes ianthinogenes]BCJ41638.1 hypothetical protein Aiant_22950 [Actinoplanes ianthinogenes]GGR28740.1 hypothetical protein GCM10010168_53640 [Actinoplanes ianthinogenes]